MSHPAASIKSIISGHTNLDSGFDDFMDDYNFGNEGSLNFNRSGYSDDGSISRGSSLNNFRLGNDDFKGDSKRNDDNKNGDFVYRPTNVDLATPPPEFLNSVLEPVSRPMSRNSTTSCISTTATKDGFEGKRFHRHGPTLYATNIITNMMQQQREQQLQELQQPFIKPSFSPPDSTDDPNQSLVSVQTTNAEVDGDTGISQDKREILFEKTFAKLPPVTFNEKMDMINTEELSSRR